MKFSLKNLKKQLIVTWGFSYVLVISIMLISVIMISIIYNNTSKKYLNEFNDYIFETVTRDTKETLLSMNQMCSSITNNPHLMSLLASKIDLYTQDAAYDFIYDLNSYEQFNDSIDSFFIYIKSSDSIISPDGIYSSYLYWTINFNPAKISFEEWKKLITSVDKQMKYSKMFLKDSKGKDIDTIALLFPVPHLKEDCTGVILSNKNNFVKGIENIHLDNRCDVYIYNSAGNLVTYNKHSSGNTIPQTLKELPSINLQENTIHTSNIAVNGQAWQVVTVVSKNAVSRGLFYVQTIIVGIIILSLIILYYVVKKILNKNYLPIKTMLSFFNITATENEYKALFESIKNALNQNKSLTKELDSHNKKLRELTLAKLLRGEITLSPDNDFGFDLAGSHFCVLTFYPENISELFIEEDSISDFSRLYYLNFIVDNVISEIMNHENLTVNTTEMDGQVVCLISSEEIPDAEKIKTLAKSGLEFIKTSFDIEITFALSALFEKTIEIPMAYNQTTQMLEYQRVLGISEPMQYIESSATQQNKYIFDLHKEQLLVNSIKTGNEQTAIEVLDQIFDELRNQSNLPFDYIVYIVLDIASTITKTANSILPMGIDVNDSLIIYKKIKNGENLSSLHTQMVEYINFYCEIIKNDLKEGKNRTHFLVSHIEKYIHDNYADPNLTVYSIGLHFNIKADYISKIFKKEIGLPLLTYITQYRVERALELTKEGKYSKKEIAEMVGFASERNFYRVLKKYEEQTQ